MARHRRGEMSRHPNIDHGNCRIKSPRLKDGERRTIEKGYRCQFLGVSGYSRVEDSKGPGFDRRNRGVNETNTQVVKMCDD